MRIQTRFARVRRTTGALFAFLLAGFTCPASAALSIAPLTWNVVGLDSNAPATGPHLFPVGARVCSTTATTNVAVAFVWDSANANVNLRAGSLSTIAIPALAAGACADAYFEVDVTRTAAAFDTTRRYHITATDSTGTASTPTPRELYVEHLISQNRNHVTNVRYGTDPAALTAVAPGGTLALTVGSTYTIELSGSTATQGYEQLEAFVSLSNTVFQVLSVSTTYSADSSVYVGNPNDAAYGDACRWENDPNSPNYRACVGIGGKVGGTIVTTYTVKVLSGGGTTEALDTLIYDFSGSSFHYNSDYAVAGRIAAIVDPASSTIAKSFAPNPANVNGIAALTITLSNPAAVPVSGYHFTDALPAGMSVASPPAATTSGCGAPTLTANAGASSIAFADGTIAAAGTCVVKLNVALSATGTLTNTTGHLFIGATDTGRSATASLTVNGPASGGTGVCGQTIARWNFPTGMNVTAPAPTIANVAAAAAAGAGVNPVFSTADNTITPAGTGSWGSNGAVATGTTLSTANDDYFQFALDTTGISTLTLSFDALFKTVNGPHGLAVYYGTTGTRPETGTQVYLNPTALATANTWASFGGGGSISFNSGLNPSGNTYFRIYAFNAGNSNPGSDINIDNVLFTGCGPAAKPTLAKAFAPATVAVGGVSTLTFTLTNTNAVALTGAAFSDALPAGVQVAPTAAASTTCGAATWTPTAGAGSLAFSGGTIPASGSCTASVNVVVASAGPKTNVSGFLSTTQAGTSTGSVASATVSAVLPPAVDKQFAPNPVLPGAPSVLTFTISNPNQNQALNGLAFTDTYPAGLANAAPVTFTNGCGGTVTTTAGTIALADGGPLAGGASCTVAVNVAAGAAGDYANTSGAVSHVVNGATIAGNTASDTLTVTPPHPSTGLLKQVASSASGPWFAFDAIAPGSTVHYRFTVENTGDVPLNPINLSDDLVDVSACNAAWSSTTLPVAVATNDDHILTCIVGPVATAPGAHTNTAHATGTYAGTPHDSPESSAVYGTTGLALAKSATQAYFTAIGDVLDYTYTVTNTGAATLSGPVAVADDHTSVTCPALATVGDLDDFFDPGESIACSATYATVAGDVTARGVTNIAVATVAGVNSPSASATVPLAPDLSVAKSNDVGGTLPLGGSFAWTLTTTNAASAGPANVASGTVLLHDDLPAGGATYSAPPNATNGGGTTGTIACAIAADALTCTAASAVTMPPGGSFAIAVAATPNATGPLVNPSGGGSCAVDPGAALPEIDETNDACTPNTVVVTAGAPALAVDKVADAASFVAGSSGGYAVTVSNSGAAATSGAIVVTDALPGGLSVADGTLALGGANAADWSCVASANVVACSSGVALAAASSSTFAFDVAVAPDAPSSVTNPVTLSGGGDPNCTAATPCGDPTPPVTPVTRSATLAVAKSDGAATYTPGTTALYTVTISNAGPSTADSIALTDILPAGVTLAGTPTCIVAGDASCGTIGGSAGDSAVAVAGASLAPGGGHALAYQLPVRFASDMTSDPLVNTSTVTAPADPVPRTASDSDTLAARVDLALTKTDARAIYTPGTTATYTLTLRNAGPSDASGVSVADPLPSGVTLAAAPSCVATGTAACGTLSGAAGDGAFAVAAASLGAGTGDSLTFTLPVQFASDLAADPLVNTASADAPANPAPATASDSDARLAESGLTIAKTDDRATYTPGGTATYRIVVANSGPSDANGVAVGDALPAGVTLAGTPSCVADGDAFCGTLSGAAGGTQFAASGAIVAAGAGNTLSYALPVRFAADLATDPLVNTATATDPADPTPRTASDSDAREALVALTLTKSDGATTYTPGTDGVYTIVVANAGPSDAGDTGVADALPPGVTLTAAPGCAPLGNASCGTISGAPGDAGFAMSGGAVGASSGDSLVVTVPVHFAASLAVDPLINTATASDPADPDGAEASDGDALAAVAGLTVVKDDGAATYTPGGTADYVVVVANAGPSAANAVTLSDPLPAGVTMAGLPSCVASGSAACGTISGGAGAGLFAVSGAAVAAGPGNQLSYTIPVAFAPDLTADPLANSVTASDPADPTPDTASDVDARAASVALTLAKDDGSLTYTPGGSAVYTLVVGNAGSSDALDTGVVDTLPPGVTLNAAPSCVAAGAASCGTLTGAPGGTAVALAGARIPAGAANTLTLSVPVAFAAGLATDPLVNRAHAFDADDPLGVEASDSDVLRASTGLTVTKDDGSPGYVPGGSATYLVTLANAGPSDANAIAVQDELPAGVTLSGVPTCTASGSASCGTISGAGGGSVFSAAGAALAAGSANALTYVVPVAFAADLAADPLVNSVVVTDPSDPLPAVGSDSDARAPDVALAVDKSDGSATYQPGGSATYTIVVSNTGSSDASAVAVTDFLPAGVTLAADVTCLASGNAACGTLAGSAGGSSFGATGAAIGGGAGNRLTFTAPVAFAADLTADPLVNVATASAPGMTGSATGLDSDTRAAQADLSIQKTGPSNVTPGAAIQYTLVIANAGPSSADGATYEDPLPAGITAVSATCGAPSGGASCPAPLVTGSDVAGYVVRGTIEALPPGGTVTVTIDGTAPGGPPQTLVNTATLEPPPGTTDPTPENDASSTSTSTPVTLQSYEVD